MKLSVEEVCGVCNALSNYTGGNPYIYSLKIKGGSLTDFELDYLNGNIRREPEWIHKIVRISKWYAEKKQADWGVDFLPNQFYVMCYLGETRDLYHFYGKYRQSMDPIYVWFPKKFVLTNFKVSDYRLEDIDFSKFNNEKRTLRPHQEDAVKFLVNRKKCILADDMGLGKMEPVDSLIVTPEGMKPMGEIVKGSIVYGMDGKMCRVLETYDHKDKDIYRVTFSDGTTCECGLEHLWIVQDRSVSLKKRKWETKSLKEIIEAGLSQKNGHDRFEIPVCEPVMYPEREYVIDPYIMGVCIGDGNLCNRRVGISVCRNDSETAERVGGLLSEGYALHTNECRGECPTYYIVNENNIKSNKYTQEVARLKLNVHGDYKFIPEEYKLGSYGQRLELLRGLMDTDGGITKTRNRISFYTNSSVLASDVAEIVASLGGVAKVKYRVRKRPLCKKEKEKVEYYVTIKINQNPFHLSRKVERYNPSQSYRCYRTISKVEYSRKSDARCIMVDNESHSYLTSRNYIVTHNTTSATVASIAGGYDHVLIICPASVKSTWKDELMYFIGEDDIEIVNGREWKDKRYTIINYDILENFYEVPTEKYVTQKKVYDKDGNCSLVDVEKTKVSKNKAIIAKAMENSQLFQSKFDLIIVDEAHKLSNKTSGRYKIVNDLVQRSNPKGIFAISGTPLTNNPLNLFNVLKIIGAEITNDWEGYVRTYCGGKQLYQPNEKRGLTTQFLKSVRKETWGQLTDDEKSRLDAFLDAKCKKFWVYNGADNLDDLAEAIKHLYIRREKEEYNNIVSKKIEKYTYDMTPQMEIEYNNVWNQYLKLKVENGNADVADYKCIIESGILRQWVGKQMMPYTDQLVKRHLQNGEKVMIACAFDDEVYGFQEMYGDKCVIFNGKMTAKQKDKAKQAFMEDDNVRIFIGNIAACGVGLTLVSGNICIFNNFSWVPGDNKQTMDRVHRMNQEKDVTVYFQTFKDTIFERMYDTIVEKEGIINQVIKRESQK